MTYATIHVPTELARHYREEADRVRVLADRADNPEIRDALLSIVSQYEALADSIEDDGE
jgi:hypothetical protein